MGLCIRENALSPFSRIGFFRALSLTLIRSGIGNLLEIKGSGGSSKGPDLSQIE